MTAEVDDETVIMDNTKRYKQKHNSRTMMSTMMKKMKTIFMKKKLMMKKKSYKFKMRKESIPKMLIMKLQKCQPKRQMSKQNKHNQITIKMTIKASIHK